MSPLVVVVGAVNVDLVARTDRLPRPGETVVGPEVSRYGGGKAANAAVAAARAGATVALVGAVGDDDLGSAALDELRADGVGVDDVAVLADVPTGAALIVVDDDGENQIAVGLGANGRVGAERVRRVLTDGPAPAVVLVSTEIPGETVVAAVEAATARGVTCVLDPAPVVPEVAEVLARGPLLTPNAGELVELAGSGDAAEAARWLATRTGAPVVVTLGGDGVLVVDGDSHERLPAHPATVRDTTGAGDTFTGVLGARLAAGDDLLAAARAATVAAALSVGAAGARTGMPTASEIDAEIDAAG